jgi:predicted CoA-binding protein
VFCTPNLPFNEGLRYPASARSSAAIASIVLVNPTVETTGDSSGWRTRLIEDSEGIRRILDETKRIAVLGIKIEESQPAYYVPKYAKRAGYEIIPVPVYYPEVTEILGEKVFRSVAAVPGEVDMVNVFRRPNDIDAHIDDIIAKKPRVVWFQLGIRNDRAAERLARAGIEVVQDKCLLVELRRVGR